MPDRSYVCNSMLVDLRKGGEGEGGGGGGQAGGAGWGALGGRFGAHVAG